jgi:hypothetical protein
LPSLVYHDGLECFEEQRSQATAKRLEACAALPARCQARLDAITMKCEARIRGVEYILRADCLGERIEGEIEIGARWRTWEVVLIAAAAGLAAAGAGVVVGAFVK